MTDPATLPRRPHPVPILLTVALHAAILSAWLGLQVRDRDEGGAVPRLMVRLLDPVAARRPEAPPPGAAPRRQSADATPRRTPAAAGSAPVQPPAEPAPAAPAAPAHSAAPTDADPSGAPASDLLSSALRDIGRIDRDLRRERPNLSGRGPRSKEARLGAAIASAGGRGGGRFSAPRVEEIVYPGGTGKRIYRVTRGDGSTYCVTVEGVERRDGYDMARNFHQQKVTNCPEDAQF